MPVHWDPKRPRPTIVTPSSGSTQPANTSSQRGSTTVVTNTRSVAKTATPSATPPSMTIVIGSEGDDSTGNARTPHTDTTGRGELSPATTATPRGGGGRTPHFHSSTKGGGEGRLVAGGGHARSASHDSAATEDSVASNHGSDQAHEVGDDGFDYLARSGGTPNTSASLLHSQDTTDWDDTDEFISSSIKVRGIRLRYIFGITLCFALTLLVMLFYVIENEYDKVMLKSGETTIIRSAIQVSDKVMDAIHDFQDIARSGLQDFYTIQHVMHHIRKENEERRANNESIVQFVDDRMLGLVNKSLISSMCAVNFGVTGFTLAHSGEKPWSAYQNNDEVGFSDWTDCTTITRFCEMARTFGLVEDNKMLSPTSHWDYRNYSSTHLGVEYAIPTSTPPVETVGGGISNTTLNTFEYRAFEDPQQTCKEMSYNRGNQFDWSNDSPTQLQWVVDTDDPHVRVAVDFQRAGVQSYLFPSDNADQGTSVMAHWMERRSKADRTREKMMSRHKKMDGVSIDGRDYAAVLSGDKTTMTEAEQDAAVAHFMGVCDGGRRHTWHYPIYSTPSAGLAFSNPPPVISHRTKDSLPVDFSMCIVYCIVNNTNITQCDLEDEENELTFVHLTADTYKEANGRLFRIINIAGGVSCVTVIFLSLFFHFSIAVPTVYLHKRIVSSLTGRPFKASRVQRFVFWFTRPFWVGDLKTILSAFTILSTFYKETRKYMPEHLRRQQLQRLQNRESLVDMVEEDQMEEKARMQASNTDSSASPSMSPWNPPNGAGAEGDQGGGLTFATATDGDQLTSGNMHHHEFGGATPPRGGVTFEEAGHSTSLSANVSFGAVPVEMDEVRKNSGASEQETRRGAIWGGEEPQTPAWVGSMPKQQPFEFIKKQPGARPSGRAGTEGLQMRQGQSDLQRIEQVSVLVVYIGYVEAAFNADFAGAERQHGQIIGTLLSIVRRYHGEIFTRRGESIGVCWNAFEPRPSHVNLAVRCARDIVEVFSAVRQQGLSIGIAVHCGPAISGSLGDEGFVMNVAFGDTIRVTFALAELSRRLNFASLLITDSVKQAVGNKYECLIVDVIQLDTEDGDVAKGEVLNVFDIRGERDRSNKQGALEQERKERERQLTQSKSKRVKQQRDFIVLYNTAFAQFRKHEFLKALETLIDLKRSHPDAMNVPIPLVERLVYMCQFGSTFPTQAAELIPKPYKRQYPDWMMFETLVVQSQIKADQERAVAHNKQLENNSVTFGATVTTEYNQNGSFPGSDAAGTPGTTCLLPGVGSPTGNFACSHNSITLSNAGDSATNTNMPAGGPRLRIIGSPTMTGPSSTKSGGMESNPSLGSAHFGPGTTTSSVGSGGAQNTSFDREQSVRTMSDLGKRNSSTEFGVASPPPTGAGRLLMAPTPQEAVMFAKRRNDSDVLDNMDAFRADLESAAKQKKINEAASHHASPNPAHPSPRPAAENTSRLTADPTPIPQSQLEDSLFDLRATNYQETGLSHQEQQRLSGQPTPQSFNANSDSKRTSIDASPSVQQPDENGTSISSPVSRTPNAKKCFTSSDGGPLGFQSPSSGDVAASGSTSASTGTVAALGAGGSSDELDSTTDEKQPKEGEGPGLNAESNPERSPGLRRDRNGSMRLASLQGSHIVPINVIMSSNNNSLTQHPGTQPSSNQGTFGNDVAGSGGGKVPNSQTSPSVLAASGGGVALLATSQIGDIQGTDNELEVPCDIQGHTGNDYTCSSSELGRGSYGSVYLGMEQHTGKFIAMKFLPLPVEEADREHIVNEVQIMQTVRDTHIVDFYDFAIVGGRIVLMMECVVPGSLSSVLKNFQKMNLVTTVGFIKDILKGLNKLHSKGIIHRDVKPQNVLISSTGICKLSDFGASASLGEFVRREVASSGIVVGTPLYMAPEAAKGKPTELSDVWAVGIMFLELINGKVPYELSGDLTASPSIFVYRVGAGTLLPTYNEDDLPAVAVGFVKSCLATDPKDRSDVEELLSHPIFSV